MDAGDNRPLPGRPPVGPACRAAGFEPKLTFQNNDYAAIAGFVAAGVGVAMIPDLATASIRDDIVLRSLGPDGRVRRIVAATKAGGYRWPAARAVLEILVEASASWRSRARAAA